MHARCSVQRNNAPYMSRYVAEKISKIGKSDTEASKKDKNPTVLVVGPSPFVWQVGDYLAANFPNVELRQRDVEGVATLDGYRLLLRNEGSRLGWRIVMFNDPPDDVKNVLVRCIGDDLELKDELPGDYVERHLRNVAAIRKAMDDELLSADEQSELEIAVGMILQAILEVLGLEEREDKGAGDEEGDPESPTIVATSLVGAKGLQAEHVFIVGISERHIPRSPGNPTDDEVCQFLVALTRAKRSCTIVTCNRLGNEALQPSTLIGWLGDLVSTLSVDKAYFVR